MLEKTLVILRSFSSQQKARNTTTNFEDTQVVEDEISEHCNIIETEW